MPGARCPGEQEGEAEGEEGALPIDAHRERILARPAAFRVLVCAACTRNAIGRCSVALSRR